MERGKVIPAIIQLGRDRIVGWEITSWEPLCPWGKLHPMNNLVGEIHDPEGQGDVYIYRCPGCGRFFESTEKREVNGDWYPAIYDPNGGIQAERDGEI
jgi:hypothetical protein